MKVLLAVVALVLVGCTAGATASGVKPFAPAYRGGTPFTKREARSPLGSLGRAVNAGYCPGVTREAGGQAGVKGTQQPRKPRGIETQLRKPGMRPRDILEGLTMGSYGRHELQVVPADARPPPAAAVVLGQPRLLPAAIHEAKKEGRTVSYLVEGLGRPEGPHEWRTQASLVRSKAGKALVDAWQAAHTDA